MDRFTMMRGSVSTARQKSPCRGVVLLVGLVLSGSRSVLGVDCNGNGIDDTRDLETAASEDCNQNEVPDECERLLPEFDLRQQRLPVARFPRVVKAGDFDGDGDIDLATGNQSPDPSLRSTVSVYLNQGAGQFSRTDDFEAGAKLSFLAVSDLDGDGDLDLATANFDSLSVLLNQGDTKFGSPAHYPTDRHARFVTAGDVDHDGFPELITADSDFDSISIFKNQGDGTFAAARHFAVGTHPTSVAAADLDADGDTDLAVPNRNSRSLSLLLNEGDGDFLRPADIDTEERPHSVLAGDFDGDGDLDLAAATDGAVLVLANEGNAVFGVTFRLPFTGKTNSLAARDLDGDGDLDLALGFLSSHDVSLLLNDGTGTFEPAPGITLEGILRSRSLLARDLDGDGAPELALLSIDSDAITVFWNTESETTALSFLQPVRYPVGGPPHTADRGDVDGDGDLDVITGNNAYGISVLLNQGDGTFAAPVRYNTPGNSFSIVAADLDNDLDLDLASVDRRQSRYLVMLNTGDGTYGRPAVQPSGSRPAHVTAAALDGDDFLDLIITNQASTVSLLFNDGSGAFPRREDLRVGSSPFSTAPADLDRDGDMDLAVANEGSSDVSVLLNLGDGTFTAPIDYPLSGRPNSIASADFDLDGYVDLVTANESNRNISVLWNLRDGTFEAAVDFPVLQNPYSLAITDMDGDGGLDVVTANLSNSSVSILRAGNRFQQPVAHPVGAQPRFVLPGDYDGDGDMDIVSANHGTDDIRVLLNDSSPLGGDYLERICTEVDFQSISVPSGRGDTRERTTKHVVPARDDPQLLPAVFQNARRFPLHEEFLREVFPERFSALSGEEYDQLVGRRASRDYFVGALSRRPTRTGFLYTFTVVADTGFDPREVLNLEEIRWVYETMSRSFELRPLAYQPDTELARRQAESWADPPFPVYFDDGRSDIEYEAYTRATGYGVVRLLTLEEFEEANHQGRFTFQDILVVEQAPRDIEGVVGGVITAEPQGELSHVAIRTARRGTPNAYVAGALETFKSYEGKLVRLEVFETEYFVTEVELEEAEAFWSAHRPQLADFPPVDAEYRRLDELLEMDLTGGVPPEARYGGKASNFARLQRILVGDFENYREPGFAIPMHYYLEFMRTNSIAVEGRELTYEAYLSELFSSPDFRADSRLRFEQLEAFRDFARRNGGVDPQLVQDVARRIEEVFGATTRMVRHRSSSNIEDRLEFNGAGLYESTSACAQDTLDPGSPPSSHCDPTRNNERTIERALAKVWASLWTFRAFEERSFYQIPQESAGMGVLVTRAFLDEVANGVAFTGNPRNSQDRRYVITAQIGEESVVSPEPGVSVERDLLEVVDGEVVGIFRDRSSSLVEPGARVLSDDQLRELGAFMWYADRNLPIELEGHDREQVLLDFEFKIEPDGSLAVKQVRPFLLSSTAPEAPTFELEVPPGTTVCGVFSKEHTGRAPREEYETKSTVRFVEGTLELPAGTSPLAADLFEEVRFGARQEVALPQGPGLFRVVTIPAAGSETTYRFNYEQRFTLPGGESFQITLFGLDFKGRGEVAIEKTLVLDEESLTFGLSMEGALQGEPVVAYSSCGYDLLPLWEVEAELEGGSVVRLHERFLPSENDISTGPASVVRGEVLLEGASRTVTDYWRLVYAARRHNRNVRYWVVLDPPLGIPSVASPIHVVELEAAEPLDGTEAKVSYLGEDFEILAEPRLLSVRKGEAEEPPETEFRRGDVSADGTIDVADAVRLLEYFFLSGNAPECSKAADADDSGRLNLSDAVAILLHLFGGAASLPEPFGDCGGDPSPDDLPCESFSGCGR